MTISSPVFLSTKYLKLILFGGKGGVGKTNCATATALTLSEKDRERNILLVSTDPAHSLHDCLNGSDIPENLRVIEFDAKAHLHHFKVANKEIFHEIAKRGTFLDDEDINQFLDLSLPGLDELMSLIEIARWVEEKTYDVIIVDTAPTGHTLRLLNMPETAMDWLDAMDALLAKHRYMKKVFFGRYRTDVVDDFVLNLSQQINRFSQLLKNTDQCCFVPIAQADPLSLDETGDLLKELSHIGIGVDDIIINQQVPERSCPTCHHRYHYQKSVLSRYIKSLSSYQLWSIPMMPNEIRGAGILLSLFEYLSPIEPSQYSTLPPTKEISNLNVPSRPITELTNPPVRLPETQLLIFAGKGGVGKTTLACATALTLARHQPDQRILLFSADPAHSLSACLDYTVKTTTTPIEKGLSALEMDGPAEFEKLKNQYTNELRDFLENLSPYFDFTFDREVMERIMDLAPPGIDEVMAITRGVDLLFKKKYDVIVLDAAPTGHLIRLMETPDLIRQWLRVFFNLFIKYKRIFRLPHISRKLVRLSKGVKYLQKILKDPDKSAVYGVTIPTEMARMETNDLVSACNKMEASIPLLFINQVTPENDCLFCTALNQREQSINEKLKRDLGHIFQKIIPYQPETTGLEALGQLGEVLYE